MKSIELQPNKENLLRTFELDAIERNVDIYRFINLLNAIEDNCSVALDGAWGSGKTFFVKQAKMVLDAYNEFIGSHDDIENNTIRTHFEAMQTGMRRVPIVLISIVAKAKANRKCANHLFCAGYGASLM